MRVLIKRNEPNNCVDEYQGFIIFSDNQEQTALEWATGTFAISHEIVEFPDVFNVKPLYIDDRMNNKVFKVITNVQGYEQVTFDVYADAILDWIQHNGHTQDGYLTDFTAISRGKLVYKNGDLHKVYITQKQRKAIPMNCLIPNTCYTQRKQTVLYLGKFDGRHVIMDRYNSLYYSNTITLYPLEDVESAYTLQDVIAEFQQCIKAIEAEGPTDAPSYRIQYLQDRIDKFKEYEIK